MRRTHWWLAAALAATVGCTAETADNPNQASPAAPSAPAPTSSTGGTPNTIAPKLGSESMPSDYPGMEKLKKGTAKDESTPSKAADEPKTPSKSEKDAAPKS
jgi:hypothetical protein